MTKNRRNSQSAILPPPSTYGLPSQYEAWRPNQDAAIRDTLASEKQFVAITAPTGFGKTIVGAAIAKFLGGRTCYTVETKALQRQIDEDLSGHVSDIRGKGNYICLRLHEENLFGAAGMADRAGAMCNSCDLKAHGCRYFDAYRQAKNAELVVTNYSYWLSINAYNEEGLGEFDGLILDEAHGAADQLSSFLEVRLRRAETEEYLREPLPDAQSIGRWKEWADKRSPNLRTRVAIAKESHDQSATARKELFEMQALLQKLDRISSIRGRWIEERFFKAPKSAVTLAPVWPAEYRNHLFLDIPKIVLMSATMVPKTLKLLGLEPDEYTFLQFPSSFPVELRPVIHVPTVRMRSSMTEEQKLEAVRRIDQIISRRLDRKGIIHTVSFARAEHLMQYSRHASKMILTERGAMETKIRQFKNADAPAILVGPNFSTGSDFPYTQAEYQILMKIPFLDRRQALTKARIDEDADYDAYTAMTSIVQMAGRIVRAADDRGETLIIDDQWTWFRWKYAHFAPAYFLAACRFDQYAPAPLPKLEMEYEPEPEPEPEPIEQDSREEAAF